MKSQIENYREREGLLREQLELVLTLLNMLMRLMMLFIQLNKLRLRL